MVGRASRAGNLRRSCRSRPQLLHMWERSSIASNSHCIRKENNSMRLPSFVSVILVLLLALIAGGVGYAIGVNSAVVTTTAAAAGGGGTVVVAHPGWYGGFWGVPVLGPLFAVLFFAIVFGIIRRAAWGGARGPRGWGGGGWH